MNTSEGRPVEILLVEDSPSDADLTLEALKDCTVRNHVSAILEKLGVSDRTQAAVIAIQHGL